LSTFFASRRSDRNNEIDGFIAWLDEKSSVVLTANTKTRKFGERIKKIVLLLTIVLQTPSNKSFIKVLQIKAKCVVFFVKIKKVWEALELHYLWYHNMHRCR